MYLKRKKNNQRDFSKNPDTEDIVRKSTMFL